MADIFEWFRKQAALDNKEVKCLNEILVQIRILFVYFIYVLHVYCVRFYVCMYML